MDSTQIVRGLVGVRFVSGGRNVATGLDCWGLVMEVYKRCGQPIQDFLVDAFAFETIDAYAKRELGTPQWEQVEKPKDWDAPLVVLMCMHREYITHAGVFLGGNRIMHTLQATGTVISSVRALRPYIVGYYKPC